jgi:hypothetical protein
LANVGLSKKLFVNFESDFPKCFSFFIAWVGRSAIKAEPFPTRAHSDGMARCARFSLDVRTSFVLGNSYAYLVRDDRYAVPPNNAEEARVAKAAKYYINRCLETGKEEASSLVSIPSFEVAEIHHLARVIADAVSEIDNMARDIAVAIFDGFKTVVSSSVQWVDLLALIIHAGIIARRYPCVKSVIYECVTEFIEKNLEREIQKKKVWKDLSRAGR